MPETPAAALRAAMERQAATQAAAKQVAAEVAADIQRQREEIVAGKQGEAR